MFRTFMTLRYPFGLPRALVTTSNNEKSEIEANASPRKPKFPLSASLSTKWLNFDVAAQRFYMHMVSHYLLV